MRARWGDYGVVLNCGEREWKLLHLLYVENAKKIQKEDKLFWWFMLEKDTEEIVIKYN